MLGPSSALPASSRNAWSVARKSAACTFVLAVAPSVRLNSRALSKNASMTFCRSVAVRDGAAAEYAETSSRACLPSASLIVGHGIGIEKDVRGVAAPAAIGTVSRHQLFFEAFRVCALRRSTSCR